MVAEIKVGEPVLLPRCDWVSLPDAPTPLCKLGALEAVLGIKLEPTPDSSPALMQIPALTRRQIKKLQRLDQWKIVEACEAATKALREYERYAS
ncbi:hypothetical protein [Gleimia coleocanis]|uniref:hypothetical protein n=1 Tax=Gleimia coleocanis TaxID=103618 RepID=UPI0002EA6E50|nr:hypothetical protein [Gleimia coleocanis]